MKASVGEILPVLGLEPDQVAYNPFPIGPDTEGRNIIAARVEHKDSDWMNRITNNGGPYDPKIKFFYEDKNNLVPLPGAPTFDGLEDPFCTNINVNGETQLLFGGIWVDFEVGQIPEIVTRLFLAKTVNELSPDNIFASIRGMKDNRLCQSVSGDLILLTRPTIGAAFPGSIGYTRITFEELSSPKQLAETAAKAKLLSFSLPGVKLGPNAIYSKVINDDSGKTKEVFHLICHVATADPYENEKGELVEHDYINGKIHYKAYEGIIDPEHLNQKIDLKLISESKDFLLKPENIKGPRYSDVVFPGGLLGDNLYVGVADRSIGRVKISD